MNYKAHLFGQTISHLLNKSNEYRYMGKILEGVKPARKDKSRPSGFQVKDIPLITHMRHIAEMIEMFDLWKADRATKAHNDHKAFVPTDRKKIIQMMFNAGYGLVDPLYDLMEVNQSYWEKRKDKNQTPRQQIQLLFLKNDTIPDHPHLRYAVLIKDCWDGKTAFTLSCAIVHDSHFQTRGGRHIVWKEYMRMSHRDPHIPGEIYQEIERNVTHFEQMWEGIREQVKDRVLHKDLNWDIVMEEALELRTDENPSNPKLYLQRYGYTYYDVLGNLYALWAFASGSFRIGKAREKKYTPTPTKEKLEKFDKDFMEKIVDTYFPKSLKPTG